MRFLVNNVLVTGFGFIGSNLILELFSRYKDIQIDCIYNATYADNVSYAPQGKLRTGKLNLIKMDLADETMYSGNRFQKQYDYILMLAACSHVDKSLETPNLFYKTNVLGTSTLLEWARKTQTNLKSIVLSNTDELFGDIKFGDTRSFSVTDKFNPTSPYSSSKAGQFYVGQAYHKTFNMPIIHTTSSNVYGPNQDQTKLLPKAIKCLITGEELTLYNNGKNERDWLSVENHCDGLIRAALYGVPGKLYGFGTNKSTTNAEILEILQNISGKKLNVKHVEDRLAHDEIYKMSFVEAESKLGWRPNTDLEIGLQKLWVWYNDNKEVLGL
jgi:dTDP-glucose 4,6-dehydratase